MILCYSPVMGNPAVVRRDFQKLEEHPITFNVKCDPAEAIELREKYPAVQPGYHMNKKHWNTVTVDGSLSIKMIKGFIDDSYALIAK